jgi:hypothetical protein
MKVEILLTPPLLANLLIAGLVIPSMLALVYFLACLLPPTFPTPFPPFPPAIFLFLLNLTFSNIYNFNNIK